MDLAKHAFKRSSLVVDLASFKNFSHPSPLFQHCAVITHRSCAVVEIKKHPRDRLGGVSPKRFEEEALLTMTADSKAHATLHVVTECSPDDT